MKYWKIGIFVSIVISFAALLFSIIRCEPLALDWATFLVAILSAIVCALIGWQIYTLIDLRKIQQELNTTKLHSLMESERNSTITCHAIADYYYSIVVGESPFSNEYYLVYYRVSELFHASNLGDKGMCEAIIRGLNEIIKQPEIIKATPSNRKHILELLLQVKDGIKMQGYYDLLSKINRLGLNI